MVHHAEPASQISPEEAAAVMDVQFAGFIERNLGAVPGNIVADGTSSEVREMISISKLNRNVMKCRTVAERALWFARSCPFPHMFPL